MLKSINIINLDYNFEKEKKQRCLDYIKTVKNSNTFTYNDFKIIMQFKNDSELVECVSFGLK